MPDLQQQVKELQESLGKEFEAFKTLNDKATEEMKSLGEATVESKAAVDKANEAIGGVEGQIKELQTTIARMDAEPGGTKNAVDVVAIERKAFDLWARKGYKGLEQMSEKERTAYAEIKAAERKALTVSDDTEGGYLAPSEFVGEIIKDEIEFSPIRALARVRQTSNRTVKVPKRKGVFAAQWAGETSTRTETEGLSYGLEDMPVHELYALVDISKEDLEDSFFNLEQELRQEFAEQFGVAEGAGFVSGNAVKKPEGFLTNSDVGEVVSGSATLLTADGVIDLFYGLKTAYARTATFLANRSTIGAIRKLKDDTNQYLWQPGLAGSAPNTILGAPYVEVPDMPSVAADAFPLAFGAWSRGYIIADRIVMEVTRDPLTQATAGNIRFIARKRVGGQVMLADGIKKQKVST